jgi:hypothetical protein
MRTNLVISSAFIVVGVVLGYGTAEWQHRRELAAADALVERYRSLAAAAAPFASELATLPNPELETRAREAAARLDRLKRAFETTTETARRELIAGEVSGNASTVFNHAPSSRRWTRSRPIFRRKRLRYATSFCSASRRSSASS